MNDMSRSDRLAVQSAEVASMAARWVDDGESPQADAIDDGIALAWALKDLCYAAWSSGPARVALVADTLATLRDRSRAKCDAPAQASEVEALAHWTRAIAHITGGEMTEAIASLDHAARLFTSLGQAGHATQTQVPRIMALAMLGRYDDAAECAYRAKREFVAAGDVRAAGKVSLNLGALHVQRGDFAEAARHSREAAVLFARVGDHEHSVMADINMADALTSLGDVDEALRIYARAHMRAGSHGFPVLEALVDESVALLQLARGRFDEALRGFESSRRRYELLAMPQAQAIAEKQLADTYLELRMLPEAQSLYERAAALFETLDVAGELAATLAQLGRLHAMSGQHSQAVVAFERAASLYAGQTNRAGEAHVGLACAELELGVGRPQLALTLARLASEAFDAAGLPAGRLRSDGVQALALLGSGQAQAAQALFVATLDQARTMQLLPVQVRSLTGLGLAAGALGDDAQAETSFEAAVELFEQQRRALPGDDLRHAFLVDHLRPYQELLRLALRAHADESRHATAPPDAALATAVRPDAATAATAKAITAQPFVATADAAARVLLRLDAFRARALAERLASAGQHFGSADTLALRERLNWLYRQERKLGDEGEESTAVTREARATELELLEIERRSRLAAPQLPNSPATTSGAGGGGAADAGLDLDALRQVLGASDALVEYGVLDNELFACVVTPAGVSVHRHLAAWSAVIETLRAARFQLETLSRGVEPVRAHLPTLTRRAQTRLAQLHAQLWAPLEAVLASSHRVIVVPHGQLAELPFAALHDGNCYITQRWELACAPSARLALHHLRLRPGPPRTVLAIGESTRLAHAAAEAHLVAGLFAHGQVCVGDQATTTALRAHCAGADIVHLACHAQFRDDNPRFSALQLHDGALTAELAEGLPMQGNLVVLSACETGLAELGHGDEMVGLVRAFLVAGSARVVASLWPVDDRITADFMSCFYTALRGGASCSTALGQAQIATLQHHPHPFFWAGFTLHGGW